MVYGTHSTEFSVQRRFCRLQVDLGPKSLQHSKEMCYAVWRPFAKHCCDGVRRDLKREKNWNGFFPAATAVFKITMNNRNGGSIRAFPTTSSTGPWFAENSSFSFPNQHTLTLNSKPPRGVCQAHGCREIRPSTLSDPQRKAQPSNTAKRLL